MMHSRSGRERSRRRTTSRAPVGIPVIDPNGDEVTVYRREVRNRIPFVGVERILISYELDTGEAIKALEDGSFVLTQTGQKLVRVE